MIFFILRLLCLLLISFQNFAAEAEDTDAFGEAELELSGIEGIELQELAAGEIRLKGEIHRKSDYKRIRAFLKRHPEVDNQSRLTKAARAKMGRIDEEGLRETTTSRIEPSLLLEMLMVEIKRSALEKMGTRLSSPIGVGAAFDFRFLTGSAEHLRVGSLDPVQGFLDAALQKGDARIHARQSLITQNGKMAEFQAGGEFPLRMRMGPTSRIEYKPFGFFLKFLPRLELNKFVHLDIRCEISDINLGSQVDGLPMVVKKNLKTQVFAKLDQMMALGGILSSSDSRFADQIPGLSSIPIMGRLFRSEDFKSQRSEAYIFVTAKKMEEPWLPNPKH